MDKKINVLCVPSDTTGVGMFRSLWPHLGLEDKYPNEFHVDIVYQPELDNDEWLKQYDIIHYHRTLGPFEMMASLNERLKKLGIVSIMDIDDHWAPGMHHPAYHIVKNNKLDQLILQNLRIADNVTTTTDIFAKEIRKYNKNVYVLPNAVNPKEKQFTPNLEPSKRLRIGWLGGSCVASDTEILTENGWKFFTELDENLKVATLNPETNEIEYHKPDNYIKVPHSGKMYNCNTNNINFSVTGNHNMYVSEAKTLTHKKLNFNLTMAENTIGKNYHYKKNGSYNKENIEYFILPSVAQNPFDKQDYSEKKLLMNDWLKFFGFFIAEGWTANAGNFEVGICQFKDNNYLLELKEILTSFGFNANITRSGTIIRICNKQLWSYLSQFGGAKDKHIPRELLNTLSSEQLGILLDWYLKGDGSTEKTGDYIRRRGYTVSKQLADDLMEIAFKIGDAASIKNRGKRIPKVGINYNGKERVIIPRHDSYQVSFYSKTSKHNQLTPLVKSGDITTSDYDGYVYCVEVKNHIIHVRRNGKGMWIGNSHEKDLEILSGIAGRLKSDGLLDNVQFVLCGFDVRGTHTDIDPVTKQSKIRNITPKESVWYRYEKIFTNNYTTISQEYKDFLHKFTKEEYPNIENEPYRRVWTKDVSIYATNYNLFDISLAPLEENAFNAVKSQLKIIEAGFHKKAIIAQNFGPYTIDIKNAIQFGGGFDETANGILISKDRNHKDWYKNIKLLIQNPHLVKILQENLYNSIKDKYSIDAVSEARRDLYLKLYHENKKILA